MFLTEVIQTPDLIKNSGEIPIEVATITQAVLELYEGRWDELMEVVTHRNFHSMPPETVCKHCLLAHAMSMGVEAFSKESSESLLIRMNESGNVRKNLAAHLVFSQAPDHLYRRFDITGDQEEYSQKANLIYNLIWGLEANQALASGELRQFHSSKLLRMIQEGRIDVIPPKNLRSKGMLARLIGMDPEEAELYEIDELEQLFQERLQDARASRRRQINDLYHERYNKLGPDQSFSYPQIQEIWGLDLKHMQAMRKRAEKEGVWSGNWMIIDKSPPNANVPKYWVHKDFLKYALRHVQNYWSEEFDPAVFEEEINIDIDTNTDYELVRAILIRRQLDLEEMKLRDAGFVTVHEMLDAFPHITTSQMDRSFHNYKMGSAGPVIRPRRLGIRTFVDPSEVLGVFPEDMPRNLNRVNLTSEDFAKLQKALDNGWALISELPTRFPHLKLNEIEIAAKQGRVSSMKVAGRVLVDPKNVLVVYPELVDDEVELSQALDRLVKQYPEELENRRAIHMAYLTVLMREREESESEGLEQQKHLKKSGGRNVVSLRDFIGWYEDEHRYAKKQNAYNPYEMYGFYTNEDVKKRVNSLIREIGELPESQSRKLRNFLRELSSFTKGGKRSGNDPIAHKEYILPRSGTRVLYYLWDDVQRKIDKIIGNP